jgi:exosome complex RNA-binding protein Rrp42 (RNase PH superfamily)
VSCCFQCDGGLLSADTIHEGNEVFDVVTESALLMNVVLTPKDGGVSNYVLLADPTLEEMSVADCVVTLAILPNWKDVTVWEQCVGAQVVA